MIFELFKAKFSKNCEKMKNLAVFDALDKMTCKSAKMCLRTP